MNVLQIAGALTVTRVYMRWSIDEEAWGLFDLNGEAVAYAGTRGELFHWACWRNMELVTLH